MINSQDSAVRRNSDLIEVKRAFFLISLWAAWILGHAATVELHITPGVAGEPVQRGSLRYRTGAGEAFSITRVSYLLSDFGIQRQDGTWQELPKTFAWMDAELGRNSVRLDPVADGPIRSLRFRLGVSPEVNRADPAAHPATHPLNPNLNGLHWSWQGGYIFLALEGLTRSPGAPLDGWSYHLARDTNSVWITLPVNSELRGAAILDLDLDFDLGIVLNAPRPLSFVRDGTSTHSRDGDPISAALIHNLPGAFRLRGMRSNFGTNAPAVGNRLKPYSMPGTFTPFPFQMSDTFPMPELPADNPLIAERVELGRRLFFDRTLSINTLQSCADCHSPSLAFTDGHAVATGAEGKPGRRNSMPLFNLAWKREFFWDGRAKRLRDQVLQPIQDPLEMHQGLPELVEKLSKAARNYPPRFEAAFGSREITAQKLALALEAYLLSRTSCDSKADQVFRGTATFTAEEQRGFELFSTEYDPRRGQYGADCFHCHGGPLFQSQSFGNNGLKPLNGDRGRAEVTGRDYDVGKFAVPSLRNVALTAPYMHDGRFDTLEEVVRHYTSGITRSATLDPNLAKHPDGGVPLSEADQRALVAFMRTLTDPRPNFGTEVP